MWLFTHRSSKYMYLRAKYTKYKTATTKCNLWDLQKRWLKLPISSLQSGPYNLHPLIGGYHCKIHNQCRDAMNNNKDSQVGQLTNSDLDSICNSWDVWDKKQHKFWKHWGQYGRVPELHSTAVSIFVVIFGWIHKYSTNIVQLQYLSIQCNSIQFNSIQLVEFRKGKGLHNNYGPFPFYLYGETVAQSLPGSCLAVKPSA